jgi:hypothetical protein
MQGASSNNISNSQLNQHSHMNALSDLRTMGSVCIQNKLHHSKTRITHTSKS